MKNNFHARRDEKIFLFSFRTFSSHLNLIDWDVYTYLLPTVIKADRNPSRPFLAFRRKSCQSKALAGRVRRSRRFKQGHASGWEQRVEDYNKKRFHFICVVLITQLQTTPAKENLFFFIKQSQLFFVFDRRHHNNGRERGEKMAREIDGVHSTTSVVPNLNVVAAG